MRYGKGFRPSPAGHQIAPIHVARRYLASGALPRSADRRDLAPAVMDQGRMGSCFGHGTSGLLVLAHAGAGIPLPWVPSQDGIYRDTRCMERAGIWDGRGDPPPLTDSGSDPVTGFRALQEWGVRAMRGPTSDGRNSDCELATLNRDPQLDELEAERLRPIVGDYGIGGDRASRVELVQRALLAGIGIGIGSFVDLAFEEWRPGQDPIGVVDFTDPEGGGHWLYAVAYDTLASGLVVFRLRNSWGLEYGDLGEVLVSEDFIANAWEIHGCRPQLPAQPLPIAA